MDSKETRKAALEAAITEAKKRGFYIPTEDINRNLEKAMDAAAFMAVERNGLVPMLDIVTRSGKGEIRHIGIMIEGVDFNDHDEKMKAIAQAGKKVGEDFGDKMIPLQVTMMSEGWMRHSLEETDDKQEVIMAATRSWDGREGFIARRTVRDLKDKITDTCPSVEEPATDTKPKATPILELFYLGFGVGASGQDGISDDVRDKAQEIAQELKVYFG